MWGQTGSATKAASINEQGAERVVVGDPQAIAAAVTELEPTVVFDPLGVLQLGRDERRTGLAHALEALRGGEIRVRIDSILPLREVNEAFGRLARREVEGKLLLDLT